ncbi:MAG: trypsin-like peptidase domain-containing protein [Holosporales bacterium]|jgi:serine protease Do|nr:trypsin-like peptidase domain-containing protein [Holosporales bacterium]
MKFVKVALYTVVFSVVIFSWERVREAVLSQISCLSAISAGQEGSDPSQVQRESDEESGKTEKGDPAEKGEEAKALNPITTSEPSDIVINFEKGFEDVAKKAMHSVVNVATVQVIETEYGMDFPDIFKGDPFEDMFKGFFDFPSREKKKRKANALGSGFIVMVDNDKLYIATNSHVVEKAKKIVVFLSDKTELTAEVHAVDSRTDIAVLSVSLNGIKLDTKKIKPIDWGDSNALNEGNFVIAIGNPFGLGSTVTHGIVSAKGRDISIGKTSLSLVDDFIQHSAPINMGNSGGCLLDVKGKVVGINNAIFSMSGGNIGIGFAIPSSIAKVTVDQLIKHKRIFRGWLGAEIVPVNAKQAESIGLTQKTLDTSKVFGAYVSKLVPKGPAESAGVKVGDIIIEFNGKKINEKCSLPAAVGTTEIGNSVKIKIWRHEDAEDWGEIELSVKVGDFENAIKSGDIDSKAGADSSKDSEKEVAIDSLGIMVSPLPERHKAEYPIDARIIVTKIDEEAGTSFFGPLFLPGDAIIYANNVRITTVSQFKEIMSSLQKDPKNKDRPIPFVIIRNGSQIMVATTLEPEEKISKDKKFLRGKVGDSVGDDR